MPKKMGVNNKAEAARARRGEAERRDREARAQEEAYWQAAEGPQSRSARRREEDAEKRAEAAARRAENRRLAELEQQQLAAARRPDRKAARVGGPAVPKVTEAELARRREEERLRLQREADAAKKRQARTADEVEYERVVLVANTNRDDSIIEARSVEDAIAKMAIAAEPALPPDRHPERRLKVSYKAFEEAELSKLKEEKPAIEEQYVTTLHGAVSLPSPPADPDCLCSNSCRSSSSTFSAGSHVASSMSTHLTRYSHLSSPSSSSAAASLLSTTASATAYSSPASKSLTRSSATHGAFTHSLSPPSRHSTRYSRHLPSPRPSITFSTSAHSYTAFSSSTFAASSPCRSWNAAGLPLGVFSSTCWTSSSGVRPCPSGASGSAPSSSSARTATARPYPTAMWSGVSPPPAHSWWPTSAPAAASARRQSSDPSPAAKCIAVRPCASSASGSRCSVSSASSAERASASAFFAAVHQGVSYSATTSAAMASAGTHDGSCPSFHSTRYSVATEVDAEPSSANTGFLTVRLETMRSTSPYASSSSSPPLLLTGPFGFWSWNTAAAMSRRARRRMREGEARNGDGVLGGFGFGGLRRESDGCRRTASIGATDWWRVWSEHGGCFGLGGER
ncbi:hypothetical protein HU200_001631 [Digitaria exilis]|uniref:Coiled-coil domain-containing protein n=1 Tax=Digitaria exilis TaxID=1010633 RepID=A0A835KWD3_9POAL|nr:hypothetical protein HU200_001631 [Digitaria exilis]